MGMTKNLLDWVKVIKNAEEIHCVDSAVMHLVDSLECRSQKLSYHDFGKGNFHCMKNWQTITMECVKVWPITPATPLL